MTLNSQCALRAASQSQLGNAACEPPLGWTVRSNSRQLLTKKSNLRLAAYVLPLPMFGGVPYSCDETSVVNCVFKPGCSVGTRMDIEEKMSVDLCDVDRRVHEPTGDRGHFRRCEWEVGG
jgi:hypothetical protein